MPNNELALKCINNSQNDINKFLNEVCNLIVFFLIFKSTLYYNNL
jgi:hypothetical protein